MSVKGLVVAAGSSGSGKTTVTLALMAACQRRGLSVQGFKVGPDFIDPGHHTALTGRDSHNLDGWMLGRAESRSIFARHAAGCDLAVVEGVMGLFDGFDGLSEAGSTAEMAKFLGLPVLLVVDARAMARSLAALAQGFKGFDPELTFAGLLANRVGSPRHVEYLAQAMTAVPGLDFLGGLARDEGLAMPERHLGLVTSQDFALDQAHQERLADWVEAALDLEALLAGLPQIDLAPPPPAPPRSGPPVRLGLARDRAFCFYYAENLRRLEAAGAELVEFSPLADRGLPPDLAGLYLGGGYPELAAAELAANQALLNDLRIAASSGMPIYAECGGMMYLSETLVDLEGHRHPMAGVLPLITRMLPRRRGLGYREVACTRDTPLGPAGTRGRGHEFHYSELAGVHEAGVTDAYAVCDRSGADRTVRGLLSGNTLASYLHLHFGSNPSLAEGLVASCREFARRK